jgi:hypothetical protein
MNPMYTPPLAIVVMSSPDGVEDMSWECSPSGASAAGKNLRYNLFQ